MSSCKITGTPPPPYSVTRKNIAGWCWLVGLILAFGAWVGLVAALPLTLGACR